MKCSACQMDKFELTPKKSRLTGTPLFLCTECIAEKREPRYLIIITGRTRGFDSVSEYIKNHRYVGRDILAEEFV